MFFGFSEGSWLPNSYLNADESLSAASASDRAKFNGPSSETEGWRNEEKE